ncbi:STE3-domain-containing protein [Peniophora sp. CONT]|nr:STE3-domain-containing protein [Peniophora sp. CONT]
MCSQCFIDNLCMLSINTIAGRSRRFEQLPLRRSSSIWSHIFIRSDTSHNLGKYHAQNLFRYAPSVERYPTTPSPLNADARDAQRDVVSRFLVVDPREPSAPILFPYYFGLSVVMGDPTYPLTPASNIIAATLLSLTLVTSGVRGPYNRGVIMLKGWVLVGLVITSMQTIMWHNTYEVIAPVLCDIVSRLRLGLEVAIPACSLIMTRRLWLILNGKSSFSESKLWMEAAFDYFLGLGVPALHMALYYVVQGARFAVFEDHGCEAVIDNDGVTILLLQVWPVLVPIISITVYCWRVFSHLYQQWQKVNITLNGRTGIDRARYMRMLALSLIDILLSLPIGLSAFCLNMGRDRDIPFWPGWEAVHGHWEPVTVVSVETWGASLWDRLLVHWHEWLCVVYAVAIFALFGVSHDARVTYKKAFEKAKAVLLAKDRRTADEMAFTAVIAPEDRISPAPLPSHDGKSATTETFVLDSLNGPDGLFTVRFEVGGVDIDCPGVMDSARKSDQELA